MVGGGGCLVGLCSTLFGLRFYQKVCLLLIHGRLFTAGSLVIMELVSSRSTSASCSPARLVVSSYPHNIRIPTLEEDLGCALCA